MPSNRPIRTVAYFFYKLYRIAKNKHQRQMKAIQRKSKDTTGASPRLPQLEFPGDVMNFKKEEISRASKSRKTAVQWQSPVEIDENEISGGEDMMLPQVEFTMTEEDLKAMGPDELTMYFGYEEMRKNWNTSLDFSADELDFGQTRMRRAS